MSELPTVTDNGAQTVQAAFTQARSVPISWMKGGNLPEASRNDGETQSTSHEKSLEAQKATMLAELDEAHRALMAQITALEMSGSTDEKITSEIADLKNRAQKNRDLRDVIKNPFSGRSIESLKADVSIQTGQGAANATNNAVSAVISANSGGAMGNAAAIEARYQQQMQAISREIAPLVERSNQLAGEANLRAKMLGLDLSESDAQRKALEKRAADKRKRGDLVGAIKDETASVGVTVSDWTTIAATSAAVAEADPTNEEKRKKADDDKAKLKEVQKLYEQMQQNLQKADAAKDQMQEAEKQTQYGFNEKQKPSYSAQRRTADHERIKHLLTDADAIKRQAIWIKDRAEYQEAAVDDKSLNAAAAAARPIIEASRAMAEEGRRNEIEGDGQTQKKYAEEKKDNWALSMSSDPQPTVTAPPTTPAAAKTVAEASSTPKGRSV